MTRSASASLRGYSYQFLESIIRLLNVSKNNETIVLEGIEDVDVEDQCIQIKYLESKKLLKSTIKKPVSLMLEDYLSNKSQRKDTTYKLYVHFGDNTGDDEFLKDDDFYKYCGKDIIDNKKKLISKISDDDLREFKNKFSLQCGDTYKDKEEQVLKKLQDILKASEEEVVKYYYPNAMHLIFCLSIKADTLARTISKKAFLGNINHKDILFGIWKRLEKSKNGFLTDIKQQLSGGKFRHNKRRTVFIDFDYLKEDVTGYGINHLMSDIVKQYSPLKKNYTTIPLTVILDISEEKIVKIKKHLIESKTDFNDGYEQIKFSVPAFNKAPIINTNRGTGNKVSKTSYEIKLIKLTTYLEHLDDINEPQTVIYFSQKVPFVAKGALRYHVQAIETYDDVRKILN